jgi:flagellar biosynthetic protein FliR
MELLVDKDVLVGFVLVLVRATTWVLVCPPFNSPAIPGRVKVGFAVALSFLLAPTVGESFASGASNLALGSLVVALLVQLVAGFALGFLTMALFAAVQMAGEVLDMQVGFSIGGVFDPLSGNNSTPLGRLYQLLAIVVLFAIDGHVLIARAFVRSVELAPLGAFSFASAAETVVGLFGTLFAAALEIALPVLAALFIAEVALGLLGKAAPQLNILVIGFAAKSFIAFVLVGTTVALLPGHVGSLISRAVEDGLRLFV